MLASALSRGLGGLIAAAFPALEPLRWACLSWGRSHIERAVFFAIRPAGATPSLPTHGQSPDLIYIDVIASTSKRMLKLLVEQPVPWKTDQIATTVTDRRLRP
jgi:hypothetical protein